MFTDIINPTNIWVGDLARQTDLPSKALEVRHVTRHLGLQHLEGQGIPEIDVLGLVDQPHAAPRDESRDAVAPSDQFSLGKEFVGRDRVRVGRRIRQIATLRRTGISRDSGAIRTGFWTSL